MRAPRALRHTVKYVLPGLSAQKAAEWQNFGKLGHLGGNPGFVWGILGILGGLFTRPPKHRKMRASKALRHTVKYVLPGLQPKKLQSGIAFYNTFHAP